MTKTNAIIIHGGGLVDPSKYVLMRTAENLANVYNKISIGKFSFESLYTPNFICEYGAKLVKEVEAKRGTIFGTCRGGDLCDSVLADKAIMCLKERNIRTIVVEGGDGSSRQVSEMHEYFRENGINIIFPIPLTIDGINGGRSIGINEAVKESIRQIENISSTALQTRNEGTFGVVIVELQGRNRDDIIANVLKFFDIEGRVADFDISDLTLRVIPANYEIDEQKLIDEVNGSSKRTLILVSEGAKDRNSNLSISELTKRINRKVRSLVVGHPSQSNNMTSQANIQHYYNWVDKACSFIKEDPYSSYSIANIDGAFSKKPIDYYAKLNPRKGQTAKLSAELENLILQYTSDDTIK